MSFTYDDVAAAHDRIRAHVHRTPVVTSTSFDALLGARVFFKCENLQRSGSFKFRGAFHALSRLGERERRRGVVTFSSGNHAQGLALAGRLLGVGTTVVMPTDAPRVKLDAVRAYGAEVVLYEKHQPREEIAAQLVRQRGLTLISPFDDPDVVAGQGTAGKELIEDVGGLDLLLAPCGGAGLLSGCAVAANALAPGCGVIGVEPEAGDDATRSFHRGEIVTIDVPDTVADGARATAIGVLTFSLMRRYVTRMLTVPDEQTLRAMLLIWERLKLVVEPTAALGAAALLAGKVVAEGLRVGVVLTGGNVDSTALGTYVSSSVRTFGAAVT